MKGLTKTFDIKINFWKANYELLYLEPFKDFFKQEGDVRSSKVMWFVAWFADPESSLKNLPEKLRIDTLIENGFLSDIEYKSYKKDIDKLIEVYFNLVETPAMRQLRTWNKKMSEKTDFMNQTLYDASSFEMLEKMMASNIKIYGDYEIIMKKIANEEDISTRGGAKESLSDEGKI